MIQFHERRLRSASRAPLRQHLVSLLAEKGYSKEAEIANRHHALMNPGSQLEHDPAEYIYAVSKLLADHGDHRAYYLNIISGMKAYVQERTESIVHDEAVATVDDGDDRNLACALPSVQGSRAFIEVLLATAILRNRTRTRSTSLQSSRRLWTTPRRSSLRRDVC